MKTMNIPGFTAESSLHKTTECYRQRPANTAMGLGVQAALPIGSGGPGDIGDCVECLWDCIVTLGGRIPICVEVCREVGFCGGLSAP